MVMKQCPKCDQQVPVACKACPCGHLYFQARKPVTGSKPTSGGVASAVKRRRTERLRQARTNRESLRNLNKVNRSPRHHRTSTSAHTAEEGESNIDENPKKRRGRKKRIPSGEQEAGSEREEDVFANVTPEKALRYSIVLAEINRKMGVSAVTF